MIDNFLKLFAEAAPWLLIGYVVAGFIKVFIPMNWFQQQLGGQGIVPIVKGTFLGMPLPLCSCGVIPAALGLRRHGASKGATTAFLVATPETGVDSVSVSYALLGPFLAVMRPIAALFSSITAGLLVGREEQKQQAAATTAADHQCCSAPENDAEVVLSWPKKLQQGMRYAMIDMVEDTYVWLLVGLGFAAFAQTYIPSSFFASSGQGLLGMLLVVLISIPMYICATASTPIAAGLLLSGMSPGAALVFMLAGPATNIATLTLVAKEMGMRALGAYLTGVLGGALLFGWLTNQLVYWLQIDVQGQIHHVHQLFPEVISIAASVILAGLMLMAGLKKLVRMRSCCSH
jgi:uncharacterized protein